MSKRILSQQPPPRRICDAEALSEHLAAAALSNGRFQQLATDIKARIKASIRAMQDHAEPVIRCALDPSYPKQQPRMLERLQMEEPAENVKTEPDLTQIPAEEAAVKEEDVAELERLPPKVRQRMVELLLQIGSRVAS